MSGRGSPLWNDLCQANRKIAAGYRLIAKDQFTLELMDPTGLRIQTAMLGREGIRALLRRAETDRVRFNN